MQECVPKLSLATLHLHQINWLLLLVELLKVDCLKPSHPLWLLLLIVFDMFLHRHLRGCGRIGSACTELVLYLPLLIGYNVVEVPIDLFEVRSWRQPSVTNCHISRCISLASKVTTRIADSWVTFIDDVLEMLLLKLFQTLLVDCWQICHPRLIPWYIKLALLLGYHSFGCHLAGHPTYALCNLEQFLLFNRFNSQRREELLCVFSFDSSVSLHRNSGFRLWYTLLRRRALWWNRLWRRKLLF